MSKQPTSPERKGQDAKSPKGDFVIQDPKAKPGNPPNKLTDKPNTGVPEKPGKNDKPADKGEKAKQGDKGGKGKAAEVANTFLTGYDSKPPAPKPENVLVSSGLLEAYDYLQRQVCKHGFPKGNVFEFAAISFLKYERKLKAKQADKRVENIKEKEKKHDKDDGRHGGRSPRNNEDARSPQPNDKGKKPNSPPPRDEDVKGKGKKPNSPPPKEEEAKGKGKKPNSPPPKDEPKGKGPQSPNPKDDPRGRDKDVKDAKDAKGAKPDDKNKAGASKSPNPKDVGGKDAVIDDKNAKKGADAGAAKKK